MNTHIKSAVIAITFVSNIHADTLFESPVVEGTQQTSYLIINHGCEENKYPVTHQSILIPTLNPVVTRSDGTNVTLNSDINAPSGLKNLIKPIQDKNIFTQQTLKTDNLSNVIGFNNLKGNLSYGLIGRVPLRITAPKFKPTSCAKSLKVRFAVADICKTTFPPNQSTANLWIPKATAKFSASNEGIGYPTELVITRSSIPESCGTNTYDVIVEPSELDIDTNLPIAKIWSK